MGCNFVKTKTKEQQNQQSMISINFGKLNKVDLRSHLIVFGYFRNIQNFLLKNNNNNPYYNIPETSLFICLSYYYLCEFFDIVPSAIMLSNKKLSIKNKLSLEKYMLWISINYI